MNVATMLALIRFVCIVCGFRVTASFFPLTICTFNYFSQMFFCAVFKTEFISAHILICLLMHLYFLTRDNNYLVSADFINVLFTVWLII